MPTFLDVAGASIPGSIEGQSILPLLRGETAWRTCYHGEHSPCYHPENATQFLTDGHWKYIWNPISGAEQLFNLSEDPMECKDLSNESAHQDALELWRERLVQELDGRVEGLTSGGRLVPGKVAAWVGGDSGDVHTG